jgi:D-glycero-D-manno-heptose 1,7-bisphosphate phosphatase
MTMVAVADPYVDPYSTELLRQAGTPRKAFFLDRDGVINVDHGYVHTPEDTDWVPSIFELCRKAVDQGYLLVVITNQAGIARGYYTVEDFLGYTKWFHEEFRRRGISLLATYYCPHHPTEGVGIYGTICRCRKPNDGMILGAAKRFSISLSDSVLIGDKASDIEAGYKAGVSRCALVGGGYLGAGILSDLIRNVKQ